MADILTLTQYKSMRGITDSSRDASIEAAIPAAEDAVMRYAQRAFNQDPVTTTQTFPYEGQSVLEVADYTSISKVVIAGRELSAEDYLAGPAGGIAPEVFYWVEVWDCSWDRIDPLIDPFIYNTHRDRRGRRPVTAEITAAYGWPEVPASVTAAAAYLVDDYAIDPGAAAASGLAAKAVADVSEVYNGPEARTEPGEVAPRARALLEPFRRIIL